MHEHVECLAHSEVLFFFKDLIYLTERVTERQGTQAGGVREGEADSQLSGEPDTNTRLDPGTLGS